MVRVSLGCAKSWGLRLLWQFQFSRFLVEGRVVEFRRVRESAASETTFWGTAGMLLDYHGQHGALPPTVYRASPDGPPHT